MATPRVFISMGTPYTPEYNKFRDDLETFLRDRCRANPRIIGKNEYPSGSPLAKIKDVMRKCHGVVVVAYERKYLSAGTEKRGAPAALTLSDRIYTTPWNHVESAMAYSLDLPLYIICQRGLYEEGLIESKIDWYVQYSDVDSRSLSDPNLCSSLEAWIADRVRKRANQPRFFSALQGKLQLSEMTPKEIFGIAAVLLAAMSLGGTVATFLKAPLSGMHLP